MKIDEEPVTEVKDALLAFFERQGGYSEVAKRIGGNPQQLYYIVSGRNDPTLKTVMRILRYYPDEVELRRALSLPVLTPNPTQPGPTVEPGEWKSRYQELDDRYRNLEAKFDKLFEQYNHVMDLLMKKMAFNRSGSDSTANMDVFRIDEVYGLIRYPQSEQKKWNAVIHRNDFPRLDRSERLA